MLKFQEPFGKAIEVCSESGVHLGTILGHGTVDISSACTLTSFEAQQLGRKAAAWRRECIRNEKRVAKQNKWA